MQRASKSSVNRSQGDQDPPLTDPSPGGRGSERLGGGPGRARSWTGRIRAFASTADFPGRFWTSEILGSWLPRLQLRISSKVLEFGGPVGARARKLWLERQGRVEHGDLSLAVGVGCVCDLCHLEESSLEVWAHVRTALGGGGQRSLGLCWSLGTRVSGAQGNQWLSAAVPAMTRVYRAGQSPWATAIGI